MTLAYYFSEDPRSGRLEGPEGRHAVTVKRVAVGETIALTDGRGTVATVKVTQISGKDALAGTVEQVEIVDPPTPRVTVVQAIPKSERAELAVDLAVQGGADRIIPWVSHRTVARWPANKQTKQVQKWHNAALAAAKQSRRAWVPDVEKPVTSNQLAEIVRDARAHGEVEVVVLHESAAESIREVDLAACHEVYLIVGPEGGIGADELELIGARAVKLGPEVLRTATAAFAALSAIGALTNRW